MRRAEKQRCRKCGAFVSGGSSRHRTHSADLPALPLLPGRDGEGIRKKQKTQDMATRQAPRPGKATSKQGKVKPALPAERKRPEKLKKASEGGQKSLQRHVRVFQEKRRPPEDRERAPELAGLPAEAGQTGLGQDGPGKDGERSQAISHQACRQCGSNLNYDGQSGLWKCENCQHVYSARDLTEPPTPQPSPGKKPGLTPIIDVDKRFQTPVEKGATRPSWTGRLVLAASVLFFLAASSLIYYKYFRSPRDFEAQLLAAGTVERLNDIRQKFERLYNSRDMSQETYLELYGVYASQYTRIDGGAAPAPTAAPTPMPTPTVPPTPIPTPPPEPTP